MEVIKLSGRPEITGKEVTMLFPVYLWPFSNVTRNLQPVAEEKSAFT